MKDKAKEFLKGCEHDGSFIPVDEVIRLMADFAKEQTISDEKINGIWYQANYSGRLDFIKWYRSQQEQPTDEVEVIYLEEGIDSMDYTQYDIDGEILKRGSILYPRNPKKGGEE